MTGALQVRPAELTGATRALTSYANPLAEKLRGDSEAPLQRGVARVSRVESAGATGVADLSMCRMANLGSPRRGIEFVSSVRTAALQNHGHWSTGEGPSLKFVIASW